MFPPNNTPAPSSGKTVDDIFKGLSTDDPLDTLDLTKPLDKPAEKEEKAEKEITDKDDKEEKKLDAEGNEIEQEEEEEDPLAEIEESLEDIDEEKLELVTPMSRREILKLYPDLFKKIPYLEKAYYREKQFTEILGTIDDARQAKEDQSTLQNYVDDMVVKGNVDNVLKLIKQTDENTFAHVVDNYLDNLEKIDKGAYGHVLGNITKNLILGMVQEAKETNNADLKLAALMLNKFAFGTSQYTPATKLAKNEPKTDDSLNQREQEFNKRVFTAANDDVDTRVNNSIKSAIENNIDPKNVMTPWVKGKAIADAQEKMIKLIDQDKRFKTIVDKLWEKAAKANFSEASKAEIRKAFLSKAKSLLEPVLKSSRNEALKGMGRKVKEEVEDTDTGEKPQRQRTEQPERRLSSDKNKTKLDSLKGKSSFEALNALMGDS